MNLQKLLAENMVRFNTKNLTPRQIKQLLAEQYLSLDLASLLPTPEEKEAVDDDGGLYDKFLTMHQFLKDNGIIFSMSQEDAAYIIINYGKVPGMANNSGKEWMWNFAAADTIKLMDSPENPEKVYTQGNVFPDKWENSKDTNGQSDYFDLVKYCNNCALVDMTEGTSRGDGVWVTRIATTGMTYFEDGDFGKYSVLYGTLSSAAAKSNQVVNTTVFTIPAVGNAIEKLFPGSIFARNEVTLADSTELDKAIDELTKLSQDKNIKITGITIQSGASGDRPVNNKSGYPKESDVASKIYTIEKPYRPKSPTESGNAALAHGRAKTIQSKLGALAPITIDYMIANGGDAAQYAKIIAKIEKTDTPGTTITKQDLQNILLQKKQVTDLVSTKTIKRFERSHG